MDNDRVEGSMKNIKGTVKEGIGKAVGDSKLQTEGKMDKAEGKIQNTIGGIKDSFRKDRSKKPRLLQRARLSSRAFLWRLPDQEAQPWTVMPLFLQHIPRFSEEIGEVDGCQRIRADDLDLLARPHAAERLAGSQDRKRAFQA